MIGVRDEYAPTFGRQNLTLWQGSFMSEYAGSARELPGHDGFMVTLYSGRTIRVPCSAPRTEINFEEVDAAIAAAAANNVYGRATAGNNRKIHAIRGEVTEPRHEYVTLCGIRVPARPQTTQQPLPKCKRCF